MKSRDSDIETRTDTGSPALGRFKLDILNGKRNNDY